MVPVSFACGGIGHADELGHVLREIPRSVRVLHERVPLGSCGTRHEYSSDDATGEGVQATCQGRLGASVLRRDPRKKVSGNLATIENVAS